MRTSVMGKRVLLRRADLSEAELEKGVRPFIDANGDYQGEVGLSKFSRLTFQASRTTWTPHTLERQLVSRWTRLHLLDSQTSPPCCGRFLWDFVCCQARLQSCPRPISYCCTKRNQCFCWVWTTFALQSLQERIKYKTVVSCAQPLFSSFLGLVWFDNLLANKRKMNHQPSCWAQNWRAGEDRPCTEGQINLVLAINSRMVWVCTGANWRG